MDNNVLEALKTIKQYCVEQDIGHNDESCDTCKYKKYCCDVPSNWELPKAKNEDKINKANYEDGLKNGFELYYKLDNTSCANLQEVFNIPDYNDELTYIKEHYTVQEIAEKYKEYENTLIKFGDILVSSSGEKVIALDNVDYCGNILCFNKHNTTRLPKENLQKTNVNVSESLNDLFKVMNEINVLEIDK